MHFCEVDGKFADAVLGQFNGEPHYLVALIRPKRRQSLTCLGELGCTELTSVADHRIGHRRWRAQ